MGSRKLVIGRYINPRTYVLYELDDNGNEIGLYKKIVEGKSFKVGSFRYFPYRERRDNGNGTILMCNRINKKQIIVEQFPLLNEKIGLWALTTGAAKRGVFHWYHIPKSILEKELEIHYDATPQSIVRVEKINKDLTIGGTNPRNIYSIITDCPDHKNFKRTDASKKPFTLSIHGGTYLIYYFYDLNTSKPYPVKVYITPQAEESDVIQALARM